MIKKFFTFCFCSLMAAVVLGVNQSANNVSNLAKQNVEALGAGGRAYVPKVICYCTFGDVGNGNITAYDCGKCNKVTCSVAMDRSECIIM